LAVATAMLTNLDGIKHFDHNINGTKHFDHNINGTKHFDHNLHGIKHLDPGKKDLKVTNDAMVVPILVSRYKQ
jgi:hypothetical protein